MTAETAIARAALVWLLEMDRVRATHPNESACFFFRSANEREAARRFVEANR